MTRARDVANIDGVLTTKGDIYAATAAATPARLGVGANGETLVADSSTSTGLRYTAGTVQANPVLNSAMQVWQRGTSIAVTANNSQYVMDRWYFYNNVNQASVVSRQATGDTTNLPNIQYAARVQRNSGQTGTGGMGIVQPFETINSIPFAGKTVTLSFYARAGANFSSASNALSYYLPAGTGTDQNVVYSGYTGRTTPLTATATLTTTWQRFTVTGTIASTVTEISPVFDYAPTGTAGANDYFEVTGVQLDIGSVALPFRTYAGTIQGELAACQRYYWRTVCDGAAFKMLANGVNTAASGAIAIFPISLPVPMRVYPTSFDYANISTNKNSTDTRYSSGTWSIANGGTSLSGGNSIVEIFYTHGSSVFTAGSTVSIQTTSATGQYMGVSAEL